MAGGRGLQEGALMVCFKMLLPPGRVLGVVLLRVFKLQVEKLRERECRNDFTNLQRIYFILGAHGSAVG